MVGLDLKGVHIMGNLDSTLGIISHAEQGVDNAVVVGGGFMGIETAAMLKKRGLNVTIVELLPDILARMLDPDVSEKVLEILEANGMKVILKDAVKSIDGKKKAEGVTLGNHSLECDMVVIAIGVQPNIGVVDGSGIKANRGIIVDGKMQTNRKDIYAAGDIAEVKEALTGQEGTFAIWPNAIEQGRVAGSNMAGIPTTYEGAEVVNILDVFNVPIVAMGAISKDIGDCEIISRTTPHSYKKLLVKDKRILGLQFVNTIRNTGPLYALMKRGAEIADIEEAILDDNYVFAPESPR
jgi:NAD(P)H-nitrite reductase large subunit